MLRKRLLLSVILPAATAVALLLLWEFLSKNALISPSFFPPPSQIWSSLLKLIRSGELLSALGTSLTRFVVGMLCGSFVGALLGIMMGWWPGLNDFLNPFVSAVYPIPKIAIFPILMIIFGIGEGSKFVAIFLGAFFPMLVTSLAGVQQINRVYLEVGKNYGAQGWQILTHILLPGSLPSILAGLRLSTNLAFVITISVEIVVAGSGLGVLLWMSWQTLRVSEIYALLAVIALLGVGLSFAMNQLTRLLVPWMGE